MRHVFFFLQFVLLGVIFSVPLEVSLAQTNTCTSNCGTGGTCSCVLQSSCVSPKTIISGSTVQEYCQSATEDVTGVCCKTPSTTGATCTGGSCRATCTTGEFTDTACASTCTSSGGSYCRGCAGTSHECVGTSEACPTGKTAQAACDNNATACTDTTKQKYCVSSSAVGPPGDGTTTTVKCDPAKFKEYAGVCFPLNTGLSETSVAAIVLNLMKWMLYLFGFLAIIAFVIAGIQYLTAAGNMNTIETAKRSMKFSIVGVIVALAGLVIIVAIDALLRGTAWGG